MNHWWKTLISTAALLGLPIVCSGQETITVRVLDRASYEAKVKTDADNRDHDYQMMLKGYGMMDNMTPQQRQDFIRKREAAALAKEEAKNLSAMRTWTSLSGTYTIEARFVEYRSEDKMVVLDRGKDLMYLEVLSEKLSDKDRRWVTFELQRREKERHDADALAKSKAKAKPKPGSTVNFLKPGRG